MSQHDSETLAVAERLIELICQFGVSSKECVEQMKQIKPTGVEQMKSTGSDPTGHPELNESDRRIAAEKVTESVALSVKTIVENNLACSDVLKVFKFAPLDVDYRDIELSLAMIVRAIQHAGMHNPVIGTMGINLGGMTEPWLERMRT